MVVIFYPPAISRNFTITRGDCSRVCMTQNLTYIFCPNFWWHADSGREAVHVKGAINFGQCNIVQNVTIVVLGVDINRF